MADEYQFQDPLTDVLIEQLLLRVNTIKDDPRFLQALLDKLNGVAAGATANQTDAYLLSRANHTGMQAMTTIDGLAAELLTKADLVAGVIPSSQIPAIAIVDVYPVSSEAEMLALGGLESPLIPAEQGDVAIRSDLPGTFILAGSDASVLANWKVLPVPADQVISINGQIGVVVLGKADIGLDQVDNTSDANKPVSIAQAIAIALKLDSSAKADNAKALAGTSDIEYMTPLRVHEAFKQFGLGSLSSATTAFTDVDATNIPNGFYRVTTSITGTKPFGLTQFTLIVARYNSTDSLQIAAGLTGDLYWRSSAAGGWSAWQKGLRVGDFGLGSTTLAAITDANTITATGFYTVGPTWTGSPIAGTAGGNQGYLKHQSWASESYELQEFFSLTYAPANFMWRLKDNGVWGAWNTVWSSINLIKQSSTTDATAGSVLLAGAYGWGIGPALTSGDLNSYLIPGVAAIATTATNIPVASTAGILTVLSASVSGVNNRVVQQFSTYTSPVRNFERNYNGTSWTSWFELVKVGDFGIGAELISTQTNLNNYTTPGVYITPASGLSNLPTGFAQGRHVVIVSGGSSYLSQQIFAANSPSTRKAWRDGSTGSLGLWREDYHSGNLISAQNKTGAPSPSHGTVAGSGLLPVMSGTWRNVSGNEILPDGYGLFMLV